MNAQTQTQSPTHAIMPPRTTTTNAVDSSNAAQHAVLGDNLNDYIVRHGEYTITCENNNNDNDNDHSNNNNNSRNSNNNSNDDDLPSKGRKYRYDLEVDPLDNDKATSFKLLSLARPHMRAFWYANVANRATIFMWFSPVPLYDRIRESLDLTANDIWTSSVCAILGVMISRLLVGVLCDRYGARLPVAMLILLAAIPCALQGVVTTATGLCVARFFVGLGGGAYVGVTFWMECMFKKERLGRIHGFTGGTGIAMVAGQGAIRMVIYPLLEKATGSPEVAWRSCFSLISLVSILVALPLMCSTDDTPRGNYAKLRKQNRLDPVSHLDRFKEAVTNVNVVILSLQHACNIGVEIVACGALNLYFMERFDVDPVKAVFLVACFSASNQAGRTNGGKLSDFLHRRYGIVGRLRAQFVHLLVAGVLLIAFAKAQNLVRACVILSFAALFLYFSQASTSSVAPYLSPDPNSMITGLIGASGTAGAIAFCFLFERYTYEDAFVLTGAIVAMSSLLTLFAHVPGYGYLLFETTDADYTKRLKDDKGAAALAKGDAERTQDNTTTTSVDDLVNGYVSSSDGSGDSDDDGNDDDDYSSRSSSVSAVTDLDPGVSDLSVDVLSDDSSSSVSAVDDLSFAMLSTSTTTTADIESQDDGIIRNAASCF